MSLNPIVDAVEAPILTFAQSLINRIWQDPAQQASAQLELLKLQQSGQLAQLSADSQITLAQIGVDNTEAQSESMFKSGWRPFIGWTCGSAFCWNFVLQPICEFVTTAASHPVILAKADLSQMMPVLLGMLGLGVMRTIEKVKT
ncbi:holin family protein [Undibacterium sp. SXout11W]|uniref:holin family protein n=1 Tax=Undibacterium sp. SXout11W TaxID=3413050 RepID=UPI003BF08F84